MKRPQQLIVWRARTKRGAAVVVFAMPGALPLVRDVAAMARRRAACRKNGRQPKELSDESEAIVDSAKVYREKNPRLSRRGLARLVARDLGVTLGSALGVLRRNDDRVKNGL